MRDGAGSVQEGMQRGRWQRRWRGREMDEQNARTSVIEWMGREGLRIIPGLIRDPVLIGATFYLLR